MVHTSGAHGVSVLAPAAEHGVLPLALHPVMTFTAASRTSPGSGASVGVTAGAGDEAGWPVGEALVVEMGAEPVRIAEEVRPLYHAALAHGANHLVTLVRDCVDTLEAAGMHPADRLVAPLLSAALDNALRHGDRAITGPVARGDVGTVRTHLQELARPRPRRRPTGSSPCAPPTAPRPRDCCSEHAREGRARTTSGGEAHDAHRGRVRRGELTVHERPRAIGAVTRALRAAGRGWRSCRRWARCTRATAS